MQLESFLLEYNVVERRIPCCVLRYRRLGYVLLGGYFAGFREISRALNRSTFLITRPCSTHVAIMHLPSQLVSQENTFATLFSSSVPIPCANSRDDFLQSQCLQILVLHGPRGGIYHGHFHRLNVRINIERLEFREITKYVYRKILISYTFSLTLHFIVYKITFLFL